MEQVWRFASWLDRLAFMTPYDIGLFLKSARTDAALAKLRTKQGSRGAFEAIYAASADPWASASTDYRYQRRKYETLVGLLPAGRRFTSNSNWLFGCISLTVRVGPRRGAAVLNRSGSA